MTATEYKAFHPDKVIAGPRISARKAVEEKLPLLLVLAHIPLGPLLYNASILALAYPVIACAVGLYWASRRTEPLIKVAYACAYLIGAEVLWRMAGSTIFWEFGKYGIVLMMIVALAKRKLWNIPSLPMIYFVLLLPAVHITFLNHYFDHARQTVSFNLSGPFALFVSCWFFSHVTVKMELVKKMLITLTIPIISVAVTTLFYTVTTPDIQFNTESNSSLSGGFGPNQVSSILGLGSFMCMACFLVFRNDFRYSVYLGILAVFFATQSVMTFSRGGMYAAVGAALVVAFFQINQLGKTVRRLLPIVACGLLFVVFLFPYMNDFTGGKLLERFEERGTTNRTEIIESDLMIFFDYPVFGVGVGEAQMVRWRYVGLISSSHTEFSRIISEHGSFGILALLCLVASAAFSLMRQRLSFGRALVAGALAWSGLFMMNAGMRLAAPSFIWGLSYITIAVPARRRPLRRRTRPPAPAARENGPDSAVVEVERL